MFKDKLIEERKSNNDTQESLAVKLNVSRSLVAKWEQGRSFPSLDDLNKICDIYSLDFDELVSKNELKDRYGVVEKKNKIKSIVIILISSAAILFIITAIIINFIIGMTAGPVYEDIIKDHFLNQYEFKLPFLDSGDMTFAGSYYFDKELTFDEMASELASEDFIVEKGIDKYNEEYIIISFLYEDRIAPMFLIHSVSDERYAVDELTYHSPCTYSFPLHLVNKENCESNEWSFAGSYEDFVDFYDNSISGIIKDDKDSKTIYVRGCDKSFGSSLNSIVEIKFIETEKGNYIMPSRCISLE